MMLAEQICAQAMLLAGELSQRQSRILEALCMASAATLTARLREGLSPEDCKADFVAAASLLALAALNGVDEERDVAQITAGDLTIKKGSRDAAANCLRAQAELMIAPYLKDRLFFRGV